MTELELDLLCAQLNDEVKALQERNKMLEAECRCMREQIQSLEKQVYNGSTM